MTILNKMGRAGQLDQEIIRDIDRCHTIHTTTPEKVAGGSESLTRDKAGKGSEIAKGTERKYTFEGESWACPVCGYVYEGKVPEDFICPRCEQPGIIFERLT